jgi:beta-N-acetylglucosaminidase
MRTLSLPFDTRMSMKKGTDARIQKGKGILSADREYDLYNMYGINTLESTINTHGVSFMREVNNSSF